MRMSRPTLSDSSIESNVRYAVSSCMGKLAGSTFNVTKASDGYEASLVKPNGYFSAFGQGSTFGFQQTKSGSFYIASQLHLPNRNANEAEITRLGQELAERTGMTVTPLNLSDYYLMLCFQKDEAIYEYEIDAFFRDALGLMDKILRLCNPHSQY